ncbi:MAG: hypothetical protein JW909_13610 [Planctomycetes bacterium]|nr:hypothetical protein [Planctomycetota bacterium]
MLLGMGDKVHIVMRRLFEGDLRRHFVGEVKEATEFAMVVKGYPFVYNAALGQWERKPELRVRYFSLSDNLIMVNVIPRTVDIEAVRYLFVKGRLIVTDEAEFQLDIQEFGQNR